MNIFKVENQQQYYQSDLLSHFMGGDDEDDQENIAPSQGEFVRKKRLQSTTSSSGAETFDKNIVNFFGQ